MQNNRFQIAGGTPGMKVSWQVTGIRHSDEEYDFSHKGTAVFLPTGTA
jgi:hypothetical protein